MDQSTMKELAEAIANGSAFENGMLYLILIAVSFLGAFFGAYIKAYSSEKGKNNAIKSDLESIKDQLRVTTSTTEQIKTEIEHSVWRKKAIESVKREKLELYLNLVFSCKESLHDQMVNSFFDKDVTYDRHVADKAEVIQRLYFPELEMQHSVFKGARAEYLNWIAGGLTEMAEKRKQGDQKPSPSSAHMSKQYGVLEQINSASSVVADACKEYSDTLNA